MKVASFNVNSIRARLPVVVAWLRERRPDVLAMQETKVQDESFPKTAFAEAGYSCVFRGQKSYNGVALAVRDVTPARAGVADVQFGLPQEPRDEARLLKARLGDLILVNTYIPQGYLAASDRFQYKLDWFERLLDYFRTNFRPSDPLVWVGDLNVAPLPIDVVADHAKALGRVVIVDETRHSGGVGEAVVAGLVEAGYRGAMVRTAAADSFVPLGDAANLVLVSEDDIERAIRRVLADSSCPP